MASKFIKVTLVRHGETTHNKQKILQGQMETYLTDLGRDQAKSLQRHFEKVGEKFDQVYASDLVRAHETCQIICDGKYNIIKNELLRERSFGVLQGSSLEALRVEAIKAGYSNGDYTRFCPEGGETLDEFHARIIKFCENELFPNSQHDKSILIVTHGGAVREFMKYFKRLGCNLKGSDIAITPNTALNRFGIYLEPESNSVKQIDVLALHSTPHIDEQSNTPSASIFE